MRNTLDLASLTDVFILEGATSVFEEQACGHLQFPSDAAYAVSEPETDTVGFKP